MPARFINIPGSGEIKYTAQVRRYLLRKIEALDHLARLMGMKRENISASEQKKRLEKHGEMLPLLLGRLFSDGVPEFSKAAICSLLDYIVPKWRQFLDERALGYAVDRGSKEVALWRRAVFKRDGHTCVKCGEAKNLHAHHLLRWADHPALRICIDNGLRLSRGLALGTRSCNAHIRHTDVCVTRCRLERIAGSRGGDH